MSEEQGSKLIQVNEWMLPLGKRKTTIKETGEMNGISSFENLRAKVGMCFRVNVQRRERGIVCVGLPWWLRGLRICLQCRRPRFHPSVGKTPWRREWQPTPVFLLGNFMDRGAWQATVHGVAKSQGRLKQLSTHGGCSRELSIYHASGRNQGPETESSYLSPRTAGCWKQTPVKGQEWSQQTFTEAAHTAADFFPHLWLNHFPRGSFY